jgi:hypothetical protein
LAKRRERRWGEKGKTLHFFKRAQTNEFKHELNSNKQKECISMVATNIMPLILF